MVEKLVEIKPTEEGEYKKVNRLVEQWLELHKGETFDLDTVYRQLDIKERVNRNYVATILSKLVHKNVLEKNNRIYIYIDSSCKYLDWVNAGEAETLALTLPYDHEMPSFFGFTEHIVISKGDIIVIAGGSNFGKALRNGTLILSLSGWTPIENLLVGDSVFSDNGFPTKILGTYPQGERSCYRFTFNDGTYIDSDIEHIWSIQAPYQRCHPTTGHNKPNINYKKWILMTTEQIVKMYGVGEIPNTRRPILPQHEAVEFPFQYIPLDPYILGVLLGDGHFAATSTSVSTADQEILDSFEKQNIKTVYSSQYDYRVHKLVPTLKELGLYNKHSFEKFIPHQYLFNEPDIRLALLQGLLDTDGSICKSNAIEYSNVLAQIAHDVAFLVRTIGGRLKVHSRIPKYSYIGEKRNGRRSYRLSITMPICPFRLWRKAKRFRIQSRMFNKTIKSIEYIGRFETTCIKIDNSSGLFIAKDFIVTHNTAFCLNLLWDNMDTFPCTLMGNEYTPGKFKRRVKTMDWANPLKENGEPKFELIERRSGWKDVIRPDNINIIDWINLDDKFYQIGMIIDGIQSKLKNGVAVLSIQKQPGKDRGLGGGFSEHLASLYLNIDFERLTVIKAKEWTGTNPNGKMYGFSIVQGGTRFHDIREVKKCIKCYGKGVAYGNKCETCFGRGVVNIDE